MKSIIKTQKLQIIFALLLSTILVFSVSGTADAVEVIPGSNLPAGQTVDDDVVIGGDKVVIDGTVNGNLMAFGSTVSINGDVNGDVMAMGSLVTVNGKVSGNVFSGAYTIQVNGEVTGSLFGGSASMVLGPEAEVANNVYFGGFSLETQKGSAIQRDLALGGYQALLKGEIGRDAIISSGALELDGKVGRDLKINVEAPNVSTVSPIPFFPQQPDVPPMPAAVPSGMRIGPDASIGGKLVYTSAVNQDFAILAAPAGGAIYQTPVPQEKPGMKPTPKPEPIYKSGILGWFIKFLREFIALMIFGSLAIWLVYPYFKRVSDQIPAQPLPSLGVGFIIVIVGYAGFFVAAGLLLALVILFAIVTLGSVSGTLFGVGFSALALAFALFNFLVAFGSKLAFALFVGQRLLRSAATSAPGSTFGALTLGVVIYALAHAIPFVGWLVAFIVTLIGLGAMWFAIQASRKAGMASASDQPQIPA